MVRRTALLASLAVVEVLSVFSCACPQPQVVCPTAAAASSAPRPEQPPPPPSYVLLERKTNASSPTVFPEADGGIIQAGTRIGRRGMTPLVAADSAKPPIVGGARVPPWLGEGWLFWSSGAMWSARTFLGELRPVASTNAMLSQVSFGPSFVLLRHHDGNRFAWDPIAGKRTKLSPPGLVDIAALPDGRAIAVLEAGRAASTVDGGKTWKDAGARATPWATKVTARNGELWLETSAGAALRLAKDGSFEEFASVPKDEPPAPKDPRWTAQESPLEAVLRRGVLLDDHTAAVEVQGTIARVDVRSGAILDVTRRVLPPGVTCEMMRVANQLFIACKGRNTSLVATSPLFGEPVIEKSFQSEGTFVAAGSTIVFNGPCDEPRKSASNPCVRRREGWVQLGAEEPDGGEPARKMVSRWFPSESGRVLGLETVGEPTFFDPATGTRTECKREQLSHHAYSLPSSPSRVLDRSWALGQDGVLRGWSHQGSVTIDTRTCQMLSSPFEYPSLRTAGEKGFAFDHSGKAWQSTDRGASWIEVAAPPFLEGQREPAECSDVGCVVGIWGRLGWPVEPPFEPQKPSTAPMPTRQARPPVPAMECQGTGDSKSAIAPALDPNGTTEVGFGARLFVRRRGESTMYFRSSYGLGVMHPVVSSETNAFGLGAFMTAKVPSVVEGMNGPAPVGPGELENPYTFQFLEPFEPVLDVKSVALKLRQLGDGAGLHRQGLLTMVSDAEPNAIPVMGAAPGQSDGMLLALEGPIWVWARPGGHRQPAVVLSLSMEHATFGDAVAAVSLGEDKLAVLMVSSDATTHLLELQPGRSRALSTVPPPPKREAYPANTDALGFDASGSPAVIRMPSGATPPTTDDPAWLLRGSEAPVALAPWATLQSIDQQACQSDTSGHRTILQLPQGWLDVRDAGVPVSEGLPMLAMVRWNAERVCLEAALVAGAEVEVRQTMVPAAYVARFGARPAAARRGVAQGAEYWSALSCKLAPAKR